MTPLFEAAFLKAVQKHSSIKKQLKKKVDMILENPIAFGEPLKGNLQGFYSCPVKRNFIIIYLYCDVCRKKGDETVVACSDCENTPDQTVKFVLLGPHDDTYA
ncbi:MAG: type II toxin-antitoxin system mRNA interferase toxin, RelE/StbE family [Proteobacteria bacterium]|nr:type II toxin-antitoxin system mRNA interferase toxin, RelE/StbE family [Pseudomonadota bacterium]MBU1714838.1 type II toxin-antitoxin system mRNA interferase toxin, RelE/StbE family [Pseudomonadota bacterium]